MTRLVPTPAPVLALSLFLALALPAKAGSSDAFLGHWTATQNRQTLGWDIAANHTATFYKDGAPAGEAPWVLNPDGSLSIKAPPGDFVAKMVAPGQLRITPPAAFGSPPATFRKK